MCNVLNQNLSFNTVHCHDKKNIFNEDNLFKKASRKKTFICTLKIKPFAFSSNVHDIAWHGFSSLGFQNAVMLDYNDILLVM
jgi:hypothetical protein